MNNPKKYDTFLSHSHLDGDMSEYIARKLVSEYKLEVWFDRWILIPGEPFIEAMSLGLDQSKTCIIIIGSTTPKGWFKEEVGKALNKQAQDNLFRVIPLILPSATDSFVNDFLELRTWVKFDKNIEEPYAFHQLICGVKGVPPGNFIANSKNDILTSGLKARLRGINQLFDEKLIDESIKRQLIKKHINEEFKK